MLAYKDPSKVDSPGEELDDLFMPTPALIVNKVALTKLETVFTLQLPENLTLGHRPGQFVEVSILGVGEAPISISSSPSRSNGTFELCVRQVGDVTGCFPCSGGG